MNSMDYATAFVESIFGLTSPTCLDVVEGCYYFSSRDREYQLRFVRDLDLAILVVGSEGEFHEEVGRAVLTPSQLQSFGFCL